MDDEVERELQAMVAGNLPPADDLAQAERTKWLTIAEGQKTRRLMGQFAEVIGSLNEQFDKDPENIASTTMLVTMVHSMAHAVLGELHDSMKQIAVLHGADEDDFPKEEEHA